MATTRLQLTIDKYIYTHYGYDDQDFGYLYNTLIEFIK